MKIRAAMLLAVALLGGSSACQAQWQAAVEPARPVQPLLQAFGGEHVELGLRVLTPPPGAGQRIEVQAQLHQMAGGIAAPLVKDIALVSNRAVRADERLELSVPLPASSTRIAALLTLEVRGKGDPSWTVAGTCRLIIYPERNAAAESLRAQLAALARGGKKLVVVGEEPFFTGILRNIQADFIQAASWSEVRRETAGLCIGASPEWDVAAPPLPGVPVIRVVRMLDRAEGLTLVATGGNLDIRLNLVDPEALSEAAGWALFSDILAQISRTTLDS